MLFASMSYPFWSICLQAILLFYANSAWLHPTIATPTLGNETDFMALLQFKASISSDPYGILTSWNTSSHFCNWHGITCGIKHRRVIMLDLQQYHLRGTISPCIGNLSFLRSLYLSNNSFYAEIPQDLGRLFRLQQLSLLGNELTGEFPIGLTNCSKLRYLDVSRNSLYGKLPTEIGFLRKLEELALYKNNFTKQIPPSLWNLSSLIALSVADNNLEGNLPEEIGQLKRLSFLGVGVNKLSGMLPSSLYNLSSLTVIAAAENQFHGSLPTNMFSTLTNLQKFGIGENRISGPLPTSITNASLLQLFDAPKNSFVGQVPSLGKLKDLQWLHLDHNNLGSSSDNDLDFITSLMNSTKLKTLFFQFNKLGGILPNSIGNLSTQIIELHLVANQIYGTIPAAIGNCINLESLALAENYFTGVIPDAFGKFRKMQRIDIGTNHLSGEITISLGNLTELFYLSIENNMLEGKIPPIIGNWKKLLFLDLSRNNLSGVIPMQLFSLSSLSVALFLSYNSLNGTLPVDVGALKVLGTLDISENYLSGEIPKTIGECTSMEYIDLHGNSFSGMIPSSIASLKGLSYLDLSKNNLSGSIPTTLQSLPFLTYLNLSFNMLDGKVPTEGVFKNASAISVVSNSKLCGGIPKLHLAACPINTLTQGKHHNLKLMVIIICVIVCLLILSILAICWRGKKKRLSTLTSPTMSKLSKVSYQILHCATEGFSTNNLIGSGSFSSVYKGFLESEERDVAIKVINLQMRGAHKSFVAECNALRVIRHRNLVKILTCCSSIDYRGGEFKALVYEYMSNGSLEKWLHPGVERAGQPHKLNLVQRLNIIIDVASALYYLHFECEHPIIHCDLKPHNVLLDDDMVAHVADFGLARLLSIINGTPYTQSSTIGLKGTIGYAPPEYGIGSEVSAQGDTYSFGILVLEMLTGRRPTEEMFKDGDNLHNYVKMACQNNLLEIVDSTLLSKQLQQTTTLEEESNMEKLTIIHPKEEMCVYSLTRIGLACSVESPKERMNMSDVTRELNHTRNEFLCG